MAFYRDVDEQLCQGDLFEDVPSVLLKPPLQVLRKQTMAGGRDTWNVIEYSTDPRPEKAGKGATQASPSISVDFKKGEQVPAFCQVTRAMLLTHGCEIDKDKKHRLVALVRPLGMVPLPDCDTIRNNQKFSYFHLPADPVRRIEEGYVDFRRLTCVAPELLDQRPRLASLTDESVAALGAQLFRFLTRRDLINESA
jgi:hypothetical protein